MYGYDYSNMCGVIGGFGFGWIFMLIFWGIIIWAIVALVQYATGSDSHWSKKEKEDEAVRILKERYARGEINKEEYEERKSLLDRR